jgi:hypothetical protein
VRLGWGSKKIVIYFCVKAIFFKKTGSPRGGEACFGLSLGGLGILGPVMPDFNDKSALRKFIDLAIETGCVDLIEVGIPFVQEQS